MGHHRGVECDGFGLLRTDGLKTYRGRGARRRDSLAISWWSLKRKTTKARECVLRNDIL